MKKNFCIYVMKYYVFNSSIVMYMYIVDAQTKQRLCFRKSLKSGSQKSFRKYFSYKNKHIIRLKECSHHFSYCTLINFCQNKHYIHTENLKKYIERWEIYSIHQICCMKTFTSTIYTQEVS